MVFNRLFLAFALATGAANAWNVFSQAPLAPTGRLLTPADYTPIDRTGNSLPPLNTTYYFDQLIDHNDPDKGTFQQRYWMSWESYQPGGPIILMTPGEANAEPYTSYLTNATITGLIGEQENGSIIVIEHRFFGFSNPYNNLSVESLQVHTLDQATADLAYFAENVKLPMPGGDEVAPGQAPWILVGGSYSGALTAWTMVQRPDVFWAGYASSAVVEAITNFWAYYEPTLQNMAPNCSADIQAVIENVTAIVKSNNSEAIQAVKDNWSIGELGNLDFLSALAINIGDWQGLQPANSLSSGLFYEFCDALEVKDGKNAPANGWGVENAYAAWGNFWNTTYYDFICGTASVQDCLGTYNASASMFTDISVNNAERSWLWFVCNQVGWYQEGLPQGYPTIVSPLLAPSYQERQCAYYFPGQFNSPDPEPSVDETNAVYHGWNIKVDRLFFATATRDPWRYATVRSGFHQTPSTATQPIAESDGFHCSDLLTENGLVDSTVLAVQNEGLGYISTWLKEWQPSSKAGRSD